MPIRNPFARRPAVQDDTSRPEAVAGRNPAHTGFERVDTLGSKSSPAQSIRSGRDTGEYKMSVVNDSGVYLPPSPPERESAWSRRYLSRNSTDTRSSTDAGPIEHFSISRESFDSYRRSFDICAKSPVSNTSNPSDRQSLDAMCAKYPRASLNETRRPFAFEREPSTPEEEDMWFEDVGLSDENVKEKTQPQVSRRRGFFAKFGGEHASEQVTSGTMSQGGAMSRFLPGRKRAQSVQGAELGAMPQRQKTPPVPEVEV